VAIARRGACAPSSPQTLVGGASWAAAEPWRLRRPPRSTKPSIGLIPSRGCSNQQHEQPPTSTGRRPMVSDSSTWPESGSATSPPSLGTGFAQQQGGETPGVSKGRGKLAPRARSPQGKQGQRADWAPRSSPAHRRGRASGRPSASCQAGCDSGRPMNQYRITGRLC